MRAAPDPRPALSRRAALLGLGAVAAHRGAAMAVAPAPTKRRLVVVLLRGAMDGLSAVQPYGDPAFAGLRGPLALPPPGAPGGLLDLGGFFGLHPALANIHGMYCAGEALILHAVAGHYRSRSHFEAQDYLESGADQRLTSGWLNRAIVAAHAEPGDDLALSLSLSPPLLLRGPAPIETWAPDHFPTPDAALFARLCQLSADDPVIGPALAQGVRERGLDATAAGNDTRRGVTPLAAAAGRLLAMPDGPRVAALEMTGWDTHAAQSRRLAAQFAELDAALGALRTALGAAWRQTAVLVVTEFGRTVRMNGTAGTDHGTGGVAFVLGGAAAGGHVRTNWPGLGQPNLFEDRDLMPTADIRSIAKSLLASQLGLDRTGLAASFPGSDDAPPATGLVRA